MYSIQLDGRTFDGYRDGRPFTLVDAWREVYGVRGAHILTTTGRVVLANAGSVHVRTWEMPERARKARHYARQAKATTARTPCPDCGRACILDLNHGRNGMGRHPLHHDDCDMESFHVRPAFEEAA